MSQTYNPSTNTSYIILQTMGANFSGPTVAKEVQSGFFCQAVVSGGTSPTGSLFLQCSADGVSWGTVANTATSITTNGVYQWNIGGGAYYKFWRLAYTFTSGTGNLAAQYNML